MNWLKITIVNKSFNGATLIISLGLGSSSLSSLPEVKGLPIMLREVIYCGISLLLTTSHVEVCISPNPSSAFFLGESALGLKYI